MIDDFDIRFYENVVFYKTPSINVNIDIKDINKNSLCYFQNATLSTYYWLNFQNMHKYDELYIEIFEKDNLIYDKIFFRDAEIPYIKKEDLTIILKVEKKIQPLLDYYSNFGSVSFDENISKTKYNLYLTEYILNVAEVLNKMFFDKIETAYSENFKTRVLDQSIW